MNGSVVGKLTKNYTDKDTISKHLKKYKEILKYFNVIWEKLSLSLLKCNQLKY